MGAGLLGGVAAGLRRLTMGQLAWTPRSSGEKSRGDIEGEAGRLDVPGSGSQAVPNDAGLLSDIRSERASVYGPSALGHGSQGSPAAHFSSREGSGGSGEPVAGAQDQVQQRGEFGRRDRSIGSGSVQSSSQSRRGGYAASVSGSSLSRRSGSTGLDSLSQVAQLSSNNTGSSASRSGYASSRSHLGRQSMASTGAASYSPSGANLTRGNTGSTRGLEESVPTSQANREESASILTDAAEAGWDSSEAQSSRATRGGSSSLSYERRKRARSSSLDGLSRLSSVREGSGSGSGSRGVLDGGHYPSASLGDAVMRSAIRQAAADAPGSGASGSQPSSATATATATGTGARSRVRSLQPGLAAPAPAALAASLSAPSLAGDDGPARIPASASWRPSPRVESAAERASAVHARLQSDANVDPERQDEEEEQQQPNKSSSYEWPKFLRF